MQESIAGRQAEQSFEFSVSFLSLSLSRHQESRLRGEGIAFSGEVFFSFLSSLVIFFMHDRHTGSQGSSAVAAGGMCSPAIFIPNPFFVHEKRKDRQQQQHEY